MLLKFLDKLRTKPKHVRDQYALAFACMFTLLIGGVWSTTLPSRLSSASSVANVSATTNAAPFSNLVNQLKSQFSDSLDKKPEQIASSTSATSTTEEALDLKLSDENMANVKSSSTMSTGSNVQFGTSSAALGGQKSVIIGTTTVTSTSAN